MKATMDTVFSRLTGTLALILLILYVSIPENASEEYIYTVEVIFGFCFLPLCVAAIILSKGLRNFVKRYRGYRYNALIFGIAALLFICVPLVSPPEVLLQPMLKNLLSLCWVLGSFCLCLALFVLAARLGNAFSGLLCLLASFALFFGLAEIYFLSTNQYQDTYVHDNKNSKYVLADQAQAVLPLKKYEKWIVPQTPEHPSRAAAHRELYLNRPLFDVRYVFDEHNRRAMPPVAANPEADVLLFGCSFTFGHGLENEQTWAWRLSEDLGPEWRITNYAFNAFGAQEMLDMLEDNFVAKPTAPFRQALFLAISGHLSRPTGLFDMFSSRYVLRDGVAVREGVITDSPYYLLNSSQKLLNGSQAVRDIARRVNKFVQNKKHDEFMRIYVSLLEQSARILAERYDTPLTVLVWPDIDEILPELQKRGIAALPIRPMLPAWDEPFGSNYHIVKNSEFHPNDQATREMAAGIAAYLRALRGERRP